MGATEFLANDRYTWLVARTSSRVSSHGTCYVDLTLPRPQYSADWGDYISFSTRMKEKADSLGVDVLLVDTGDRVEGNGLYDASDPKGKYLYDIFREQEVDIICTGNHELYQLDTAAREYDLTVPNFKGRYLASNLDYIDPKTGKQVPMAQRYRLFTTKNQGIRVLAFGFLFDFPGNAKNTVVQPVEKTIQEQWFQDAIREKVDIFVVIGHVTLPGPEYKALYNAIRKQNWDTPIQFFGGHSHIRDFHKYDSSAYGLQAGRYMETIGWMSIEGIKGVGKKQDPKDLKSRASMKFERRYIDNNLFGYYYHTGLNESTFPTEHGQNVSASIHEARNALNLDHSFGCAPKDLWLNRTPYPSNGSVLTWLETEVIPEIIVNSKRKDNPTLAIINSGAIRFDIFKGPFTIDTTYIISPFVSKFMYIRDVPYRAAKLVQDIINHGGRVFEAPEFKAQLAPPEQMSFQTNFIDPLSHISNIVSQAQMHLSSNKGPELLPGYTTKDDAGDEGDDTLHAPISFYKVPNVIQSDLRFPEKGDPEIVDLVFIDFLQPWVLMALRFAGATYTAENVTSYTDASFTDLMAVWIKEHWTQDC